MTNEQWENIVKFAILVLGAAIPITISVWKYFNLQEVKAREQAFGAKKVKELEEMIERLQHDITALKLVVDNFKQQLHELSQEFKELMKQIYSNFLGRR